MMNDTQNKNFTPSQIEAPPVQNERLLVAIKGLASKTIIDAGLSRAWVDEYEEDKGVVLCVRDPGAGMDKAHALFQITSETVGPRGDSARAKIFLTNLLDVSDVRRVIITDDAVEFERGAENDSVLRSYPDDSELELVAGMLHVGEIVHGKARDDALALAKNN